MLYSAQILLCVDQNGNSVYQTMMNKRRLLQNRFELICLFFSRDLSADPWTSYSQRQSGHILQTLFAQCGQLNEVLEENPLMRRAFESVAGGPSGAGAGGKRYCEFTQERGG